MAYHHDLCIVMAMPENTSIDLQTALMRIEKLEAELAGTKAKLAETEIKLAAAAAEIAHKDQIIAALQQRLFGSKSERLNPAQLQLELDALTMGKPEPSLENGDGDYAPEAQEDGVEKPKRKRRRKADLFPKNLPIIIEAVDIPDEVAADPNAFTEIGEEHHDELDITRAAVFWRRWIRKKFVSKKDRSRPPLMPPAPRPSIPGAHCAPGLMAQIITDKYTDHLPHYRQELRFLRQQGIELSRQTVNNWTHATADLLTPIGQAIKRELLGNEVLQVDEWSGATEPDHRAARRVDAGASSKLRSDISTPAMAKPVAVTCGFISIRRAAPSTMTGNSGAGTIAYSTLSLLSSGSAVWLRRFARASRRGSLGYDDATNTILWTGKLQCDGFSAYRALAARFACILLAACLAHIRRKFMEAREQAPEIVLPILALMQQLYRIESWMRKGTVTSDCRLLVRRVHSRPLVDDLKRKIDAERKAHLPHSKLGEAITYALGQWDEFVRYLDDGRLEIDNNLCENAVRPTKLGEKNHLFFGSAEAGVGNALLYTWVRNCRVNDIDPEVYLAEVIRRMPENPTVEQAAALTPAAMANELRSTPPASIILAKASA